MTSVHTHVRNDFKLVTAYMNLLLVPKCTHHNNFAVHMFPEVARDGIELHVVFICVV